MAGVESGEDAAGAALVERLRRAAVKRSSDAGSDKDGVLRIKLPLCTLTPLFGGGVEAGRVDCEHPIRGKEVRHHLRTWWRLLAETGSLPGQQGAGWNGGKLTAEQARRFGGDDGTRRPSRPRVLVRVDSTPVGNDVLRSWQQLGAPAYVHGLYGKDAKDHRLAPAGVAFDLIVEIVSSDDEEARALHDEMTLAIRWWLSFGGVGGRVRRGVGRVAVAKPCGAGGLSPVDVEEARSAGFDLRVRAHSWPSANDAWRFVVSVFRHFRQGHEAQAVLEFIRKDDPFLEKPYTLAQFYAAVARQYGRPARAFERMRPYCSGVEFDRVVRPPGEPRREPIPKRPNELMTAYRPGRSTHTMADTLREAMCSNWPALRKPKHVPVHRAIGYVDQAAFGLPIGGRQIKPAHDAGGNNDDFSNLGEFMVMPEKGDRMDSPLLIGVRPDVSGQWEAWMLLLPEPYRRAALEQRVRVDWWPNVHGHRKQDNAKPKSLGPFPVWDVSSPFAAKKLSADVPPVGQLGKGQPGRPDATDPLGALLNYFDKCQPN